MKELNAFMMILKEDFFEKTAKVIFPTYDFSMLPDCDKMYFELTEHKKNEFSQYILNLYKQENQFVLQVVKHIQNYILDRASTESEKKIVNIPSVELSHTPPQQETEEKIQTLYQSGATGTESALDETHSEIKTERKKKKKKKHKKKSIILQENEEKASKEISPLLKEILEIYSSPEEMPKIKEKLLKEHDLCELMFTMYLANKESAARNIELELQVKNLQLKLSEKEEADLLLSQKYKNLQKEHQKVTQTLEEAESSIGLMLKKQEEKMHDFDEESMKRKHQIIKSCMEMEF